jgi:hypothetical protein
MQSSTQASQSIMLGHHCVYDTPGNVIETHEPAGDFKEP